MLQAVVRKADTGVIISGDASFEVEDVIKLLGGKIGHVGHVDEGHVQRRRQSIL